MEQHEERLRDLEKRYMSMIQDIHKSYLRKLQGDMHRCAANCCDDKTYSMEKTQNCIQNCSVPVENAQQYVQSEISRLQNRWSRCIMECNDATKDKATSKELSSDRLSKEFDKCAVKCVDTQFDLVKTTEGSLKKVLESGQFNGQI